MFQIDIRLLMMETLHIVNSPSNKIAPGKKTWMKISRGLFLLKWNFYFYRRFFLIQLKPE